MIVRRGNLTDHYVEGDRSVVMVNESVLGLSPVATAILEAVPEGTTVTLQAVTSHVVATFGPPEAPLAALDVTRQQVWDLVAHEVLVVIKDGRPGNETRPDCEPQAQGLYGDRGEAVTALRSALRHLRSDAPEPWPAPQSLSADALLGAARQHHVVPYLTAHLDRLDLPEQARSELLVAASRQHSGAKVLASDLSVALDALSRAGVRALAFKGVTLATQAYGEFSSRGAGDLDLLVAPDDIERAHAALREAGWAPSSGYPAPGPSWAWRHLVRTGYELLLSSARSDIDLHWHLAPTRGTFPDFAALWRRREYAAVDGHATPTLSAYDALAHSASHAAKDRWKWMRSLLDVHVLAARRDTWLQADRPLRGDQLFSLGLAVRAFGVPPGAPPVVEDALRAVTDATWVSVHRDQVATTPTHRPLSVPGINFLLGLRGVSQTQASPQEVARLLSRSALPPWITADLESPWAVSAVPRALGRRIGAAAQGRRI